MSPRTFAALLTALLVGASSCGPLNQSVSTSTSGSTTNYWQGTMSGSEGANSIDESFTGTINEDSSGNVTGSVTASDGSTATITGVVDGTTFTSLSVAVSSTITTSGGSASCSGTLTGSGTYDGDNLTATLSGNVNCGPSNLSLSLQLVSS